MKPLGSSGTSDPLNQRGSVNLSAEGKFSLIDLEALASDVEGDRAEDWALAA